MNRKQRGHIRKEGKEFNVKPEGGISTEGDMR